VIDNVWYESTAQRDAAMTRFVNTAREGVRVLGPASAAGRRIGQSVDYFTFMQRELPVVLGRWREHQRARDTAPSDAGPPDGDAPAEGGGGATADA
jgi:hypothetical protein